MTQVHRCRDSAFLVWAFVLALLAPAQGLLGADRVLVSSLKAEAERIETTLNRGTPDLERLRDDGDRLFDAVIAYVDPRDEPTLFLNAAALSRMTRHFAQMTEGDLGRAQNVLRTYPLATKKVAMAIAEGDDVVGVYDALQTLYALFPQTLEPGSGMHQLAVAYAVVHDRDFERQGTQSGPGRSIRGRQVFNFHLKHKDELAFPVDQTPFEAFVYIMDSRAHPTELAWARSMFRGKRDVGTLFDTINYDHAHFAGGKPKKIEQSEEGYTLKAIRRFGGICVDQAYFAEHVGKALGIPTATISARGQDVGHAWVAYLETQGGEYAWNLESGRFGEYERRRGTVTNPQTGRDISEARLRLTARLFGTPELNRLHARALADAADRLGVLRNAGAGLPPDVPTEWMGGSAAPVRSVSVEDQLKMYETAARLSPADARPYLSVSELASRADLPVARLKRWVDAVFTICDRDNADFAVEVSIPMVLSVDDPAQRVEVLEWVHEKVKRQPDAASDVLFAIARSHEQAGDTQAAFVTYRDIATDYAREGGIPIEAVREIIEVLPMPEQASRAIDVARFVAKRNASKPDMSGEFLAASNYAQINQILMELHRIAGNTNAVEKIRRTLETQGVTIRRE